MKRVPMVAVDKAGRATNAEQLICSECDGETFRVFIHGDVVTACAGQGPRPHLHYVCSKCETPFCREGAACKPPPQAVPRG